MPKKKLTWSDYQKVVVEGPQPKLPKVPEIPNKQPILYPVYVWIEDGKIRRERILTTEMEFVPSGQSQSLLNQARSGVPSNYRDELDDIYDHYHKFFSAHDEAQGGGAVPSPLDFHLQRPVLYLIYMKHSNWAFSGHKQFDVENDNPHNPAVRQVAVFDGMRGILVHNNDTREDRLKYNLYVTISQTENVDGVDVPMSTDIIIDPGMNGDN